MAVYKTAESVKKGKPRFPKKIVTCEKNIMILRIRIGKIHTYSNRTVACNVDSCKLRNQRMLTISAK